MRLFTYIFVEDEHGEVLVFEIPERLKELADRLDEEVGTSLAISREGTNRNSAILVIVVGHDHVEELDIFRFVDTLGHHHEVVSPAATPSESPSLPKA